MIKWREDPRVRVFAYHGTSLTMIVMSAAWLLAAFGVGRGSLSGSSHELDPGVIGGIAIPLQLICILLARVELPSGQPSRRPTPGRDAGAGAAEQPVDAEGAVQLVVLVLGLVIITLLAIDLVHPAVHTASLLMGLAWTTVCAPRFVGYWKPRQRAGRHSAPMTPPEEQDAPGDLQGDRPGLDPDFDPWRPPAPRT